MRRFDLVTLDLDGTLVPNTTVFEIVLAANGLGKFVQDSDARYFAGTTTLEECFWEQWPKVQALTPADLHRALRQDRLDFDAFELLPNDSFARLFVHALNIPGHIHFLVEVQLLRTEYRRQRCVRILDERVV